LSLVLNHRRPSESVSHTSDTAPSKASSVLVVSSNITGAQPHKSRIIIGNRRAKGTLRSKPALFRPACRLPHPLLSQPSRPSCKAHLPLHRFWSACQAFRITQSIHPFTRDPHPHDLTPPSLHSYFLYLSCAYFVDLQLPLRPCDLAVRTG